VGPLIGAGLLIWLLIESIGDLADPENSELGTTWLGVGPPLVIGIGIMLIGITFMIVWRFVTPRFWDERPSVAGELLEERA
jgi:hypothetical protein